MADVEYEEEVYKYWVEECPMKEGWEGSSSCEACTQSSWDRCGKCVSYTSEDDCKQKLKHHMLWGIHKAPQEAVEEALQLCVVIAEVQDAESVRKWRENESNKKARKGSGSGSSCARPSDTIGLRPSVIQSMVDKALNDRIGGTVVAEELCPLHVADDLSGVITRRAPSQNVRLRPPTPEGTVTLPASTMQLVLNEVNRSISCLRAGKDLQHRFLFVFYFLFLFFIAVVRSLGV